MNWMHPLRIALNYGVRIYFPKNDNKFNSAQVIPASLDETRVTLCEDSRAGKRRNKVVRIRLRGGGLRYLFFTNRMPPLRITLNYGVRIYFLTSESVAGVVLLLWQTSLYLVTGLGGV